MASMMMDRPATMPAMPGMGMPTSSAMPASWVMVPQCKLKMQKVTGGIKINCVCEDPMATKMVQSLCNMFAGGMCSCAMMMNGMVMCTCNLTMGMCKCEMTDNGVSVTCMSGDKACCDMIQACCDCMTAMLKAGCSCCMCLNNNPICCGC